MECRNTKEKHILARTFLISALSFILFGIISVYDRTIYNRFWFVFYFVFELLFFLGLSSGSLVILKKKKRRAKFKVSRQGKKLLTTLNILALFSFVYFLYLYNKNIGFASIGTFTADKFEEGRGIVEKATVLLMQMGGEMAYLIMNIDGDLSNTKRLQLAKFCLFLPGIRSLILGNRFTIAVEFLVLLFSNWTSFNAQMANIWRGVKKKIIITLIGVVIIILFIYLFSSRSVHYTAIDRFEFYEGDQILKPFWENIYYITDGKIEPLYVLFDYLTEAPYVFSYYCEHHFPSSVLYGQLTFRWIFQILNTMFGIGRSYLDLVNTLASGKYSGFGYILFADFGLLAPIMAYLIGIIFSKIEYNKDSNATFAALFPLVQAICVFAPVYYFYVGRCDYPFFFTILFVPFCIKSYTE